VFRESADRRLRDRVQIVLMAHRGRPRAQIAADLGISRRTVPRWLNAYVDCGLPGLTPRKAKGAAAKVPAELADEVKRWVAEGPAKQGLDRANWTYAELADHLLKVKGVRASRSAVDAQRVRRAWVSSAGRPLAVACGGRSSRGGETFLAAGCSTVGEDADAVADVVCPVANDGR
jgi:transposase